MYTGLQHMHSYVAYLALIVLIIAAVNALIKYSSKAEFKDSDKKLSLFGLIFTHIQLLVGLILYFVSPNVKVFTMSMGEIMKDSNLRLYAIEHPFINIVAVILITIGFSKHKKATTSTGKFKSIAILYTIGLLLILSRIPWSNWL
ncbi:MAG TPA: hypothetical protein VKZ80_05805 [Flavobacterium sp.]|nr:hypothetical protein [Flavobacterium sp.]